MQVCLFWLGCLTSGLIGWAWQCTSCERFGSAASSIVGTTLALICVKGGADLKGAADRIKIWAREALSLSDDDAVTVSEINCRYPGCPGVETAILVMRAGAPTRMFRIACRLAEVRRADLETALD
jgi:hypothetical protein